MIKIAYLKHELAFKFEARTSRGSLFKKPTIFITLLDTVSGTKGFGEVSIIGNLSTETINETESVLKKMARLEHTKSSIKQAALDNNHLSGLCFALETALWDLENGGVQKVFENDFFNKEQKISINGLIWMGEKDFLKEQITKKLESGFRCLKMKVGALDFEQELEVLSFIRKHFKQEDLVLRVDANGGFSGNEALKKLNVLSQYDLHSIEQPIPIKQWETMKNLCLKSPIPIALDEELIAFRSLDEKVELLNVINPQYIILKPGIMGGFAQSTQWITAAKKNDVGWWITSALESNIGLNAICQYTYEMDAIGHQGLGTGQLFHNNIDCPLTLDSEHIFYERSKVWDFSMVDAFQ